MSLYRMAILSRDAEAYRAALSTHTLRGLELGQTASCARDLDPEGVEILIADPDLAAPVVAEFGDLVWLQSTWAGNTPLVDAGRRDYQLTGVKGIFGHLMREYVAAYLLHFSRAVDRFHPRIGTPDATKPIAWDPPAVGTLKGKRVGVLGAGSIGTALVDLARCFEFQIIGLTRSGHSTGEFDAVYAAADKLAMASQCDFLVSLLPDTPATRHFIDAALLSALPTHCVLINAGRGGNIDDSALLAALDRGTIKAAVLDVFDEEPLPSDHPYWQHPRVWITQHTAALSNPADVVNVFADNYRRWISGEPLDYLIDFDEGY